MVPPGLALTAFAACAVSFVALAVAVRPGPASVSAPRLRLRIAALATAAWAVLAGWLDSTGADDATLQIASLALAAVWLWQLDSLAGWQKLAPSLRQLLRWSGLVLLSLCTGWLVLAERADAVPIPGVAAFGIAGLALCALGLLTIEQLHRNAPEAAELGMRWLAFGIGGVLVAVLVVHAQALLVAYVPGDAWAACAVVFTVCAIAMFQGARSMPQWSMGLSISRQVAFYAGSFLLIGGYLMLLSLAGWLLLSSSGEWPLAARVAFSVLAAVLLAFALLSQGMLRRLKVFISTHFYPQRYDYRSEWLRFTRTLSEDSRPEAVPGCAIRAVAQIVASEGGSLWRRSRGGTRFELAKQWPLNAPAELQVAADDPLPEYLSRTGWLIDLRELHDAPGPYGGLSLEVARYGAKADGLVVPLLHAEQLYGWILLERPSTLGPLDFEDRDLLKTAGRHVAAHLAQFDADARLAESHQFETYNRMTAFVMHDLKNIAAQLRLISQNAERHRRNPEFVEDSFRTIEGAAARMTKLIGQLTAGSQGGTVQTLDLAACAERAALRCSGAAPVPQVNALSRPTVIADMDRLASVIEHAIRNAQDATEPSGMVRVEVEEIDGRPSLSVIDTGTGMDAAFVRERLFRPFDTTKGARGMGIGAFQVREYVRSLGGDVEVSSEPGKGTRMTLLFSGNQFVAAQRAAG